MDRKQTIIEEIIKVARKLGTKSLGINDFLKNSGISKGKIRYYFGSWSEAIKQSGLETKKRYYKRIENDALLSDLIKLYNEYHKKPTWDLVNSKGKYSTKPYIDRWGNIDNAFNKAKINSNLFKKSNYEKTEENKNIKIPGKDIKQIKNKRKGTVYGEPINFRGLTFAPINENGVIYLFGMISNELGFLIESIKNDYPDCVGKRCFDEKNNLWQEIKIEFEYKSSNFKEHGHDENNCDVIVCWIHDWKECQIDVLELRNKIKELHS